MTPLRVIHMASLRSAQANSGVVQQMEWERAAADEAGLRWESELWTNDARPQGTTVLRQTPGWMSNFLLRRLHFHIQLRKKARNFDRIVIRHAPLDPFFQLLPKSVKRRTWYVFHTKTGDYLRGRGGRIGRLFAWLDQVATRNAMRDAAGVIGVTGELAAYERERLGLPNLSGIVYPNGLHLPDWDAELPDRRQGVPKIIFIASLFHGWNGLEPLLQSIVDNQDAPPAELHLVGRLLPSQQAFIADHGLGDRVIAHGSLKADDIQQRLAAMDISLGAFRLHEVGLTSACTLKVRESLGAGTPVCSGHHDVGLDGLEECYRIIPADWTRIVHAATAARAQNKADVRRAARPRIDKTLLLSALYEKVCSA